MNKVAFLDSYLQCAIWSSTDENGDKLDDNYSKSYFTDKAYKLAQKDCNEFISRAGELLNELDSGRAGYLFWLDRNGHGTGFWDEMTISEEARKALSELADTFGECYVFVNDDGELDIESC